MADTRNLEVGETLAPFNKKFLKFCFGNIWRKNVFVENAVIIWWKR